ncbi:Hypothetical protein SRAE_1000106300 [Strongyloides ratti]|uniref:Ig-like domain-containing protein n=1 Tax=Strongyloides ratti TaxID=34506 RepID=A0A090L5N8_STRRB|nr:Hypothetical protein SRAE_1000106300 [Strongyloides ratti]CEF62794.1 Hypothetical protein SRAE_1000106300 [Strongyloides ratti]
MIPYLWKIFKISFTILFLFLSTINGNDRTKNADGISFVVKGLAKPSGSSSPSQITSSVGDYKEFIENIKFHKTTLFKMRKIRIKMDTFVDQQGVKVEFKNFEDNYLSIARKSKSGQYELVSEKAGDLKIICSVTRCEPGIVLLSKARLTNLEGVTTVDVEGAFYLEFYNNIPYIARKINTKRNKPFMYICPGPAWIHGSTDFNYEIHEDSQYWFEINNGISNMNERYPPNNAWENIMRSYGSIFPVPVVGGITSPKRMICGTIKRFTDNSPILEWAYEINYINISPDQIALQETINKQNSILKDDINKDLFCNGDNSAVSYVKVGYLPNSQTKDLLGKYVYEPSKSLRYLFHDYHVIFYKYNVLKRELEMKDEYHYDGNSVEPACIKHLLLNYTDIVATMEVNPSKSNKEYKKVQIDGKSTSIFEITHSSFDKTLSKIDIQCKVESNPIGLSLDEENKRKFNSYFKPYFSLGYKKIDKTGYSINSTEKMIPNGVLHFNKSDFNIYGMYQCTAKNIEQNIRYLKNEPEIFLILPKNDMTFNVEVEVSKNGSMNKECYFELGIFANLSSITMQHNEAKVTAKVNELKNNGYFEVINGKKKYVQLKGDLKKGDTLLCTYKTRYNTTLHTKVAFHHEDDFINSEAASTKTKKNTLIFVAVSIVLFLLIIGITIGAFVLLRKRRRRKRLRNTGSLGSLSTTGKRSRSSFSKSKSSNSKSRTSRYSKSKTSKSLSKSQRSKISSKLVNLNTQN